MTAVDLAEYRLTRNYIRPGDPVRVLLPGRRQRVDTTVRRIRQWSDGRTEIEVRDPHNGAVRTVTPERITRKAVSRGGAS